MGPAAATFPPLFPASAPRRMLGLAVDHGHTLYVEECGTAEGLPLVFLHGGPGSGCSPAHRRFFDPTRFRAVLFDQRGCGRSTPRGSLAGNDTPHLIADLERIREALGIERWLVFGGSWGSLLALAYAQAHPDRVLGLVLRGIFLGSRAELAAYTAPGPGHPRRATRALAAGMPPREQNDLPRHDLTAAYCRRLLARDLAGRRAAARGWLNYERALMGEAPLAAPPSRRQLAKARLQAHYLAHGCFTDAAQLLAGCARLRHLPAAIVHGSRDPVCPLSTAAALHRAWPEASWRPVAGGVAEAGHSAFAPAMAAACLKALDEVASRVQHPAT